MTATYEILDKLHEDGKAQELLEETKRLYKENSAFETDVDFLWRYARACYTYAASLSNNKSQTKKELFNEGQQYIEKAYKLNENNFYVIKYAAILTGALTDFLSTKERIQQGFIFKGYLDRGLEMQPQEQTLLHMRGRFSYSVANLSWLERKAAAAFFATPPNATFDEAIADFLEVEKIVSGTWIENLLYLAKSYIGKGDKKIAVQYLEKVLRIEPSDESDIETLKEAKILYEKNK